MATHTAADLTARVVAVAAGGGGAGATLLCDDTGGTTIDVAPTADGWRVAAAAAASAVAGSQTATTHDDAALVEVNGASTALSWAPADVFVVGASVVITLVPRADVEADSVSVRGRRN